ncbi:MAG: ABC transporter permease [Gemmatimonadetes bacterium]|nr:ABC transporter permease [Gemmatimonadota bacterium]
MLVERGAGRLDALEVGGATILVVIGLCLVVALVVGLYPYVRFAASGSTGLSQRGSRGSPGASRGRAAVGDALVGAQVALAFVLLAGSALLMRSFQNLRAVEPGFRSEHVLVARVALPADGYATDGEVVAFLDLLEERLRALPGVRAAAVGPSPMALGGCSGLYVEDMVLPEGSFPPCAGMTRVGAGYFELLGVPLLSGRTLSAADVRDGAAVAVVSEGLARRLWPGSDPLGRGLRPAPRSGPPWYRVVGVVADVRGNGPAAPPTETLYFPPAMALDPWGPLRSTGLLLAVEPGAEGTAAPALRAVVADMDPDVPVTVEGGLDEQVARSMVRTSFTLFLLGSAATVALVLGLVGLYGVVSYRVGSRRAEFGIRMAMGARGQDVRNLVLRRSLGLAAAGTVLGVVAALGLTRLLESLLHDVRPGDPWLLSAAALTLLATAAVAAWIPAQRATRVDPAVTLRSE